MTGPVWILAGAAVFALVYAIGLRARTRAAQAQLDWPLESDGIDIPGWVNQGNRAVIGQYEEILEAIRTETHFALWEHELEQEVGE